MVKSPVTMMAIAHHAHYDASGLRVEHDPGDTYELTDGGGMTADELANSFVAQRIARRVTEMTGKKKPAPAKK